MLGQCTLHHMLRHCVSHHMLGQCTLHHMLRHCASHHMLRQCTSHHMLRLCLTFKSHAQAINEPYITYSDIVLYTTCSGTVPYITCSDIVCDTYIVCSGTVPLNVHNFLVIVYNIIMLSIIQGNQEDMLNKMT